MLLIFKVKWQAENRTLNKHTIWRNKIKTNKNKHISHNCVKLSPIGWKRRDLIHKNLRVHKFLCNSCPTSELNTSQHRYIVYSMVPIILTDHEIRNPTYF
jgi:hypothetical protein